MLKTWGVEIFFWKVESLILRDSDGWISSPLGFFSLWKIFLHVPLQLWKMFFQHGNKSFTTLQKSLVKLTGQKISSISSFMYHLFSKYCFLLIPGLLNC